MVRPPPGPRHPPPGHRQWIGGELRRQEADGKTRPSALRQGLAPPSLIEEVGGRVFPLPAPGYDAQLLNDFQAPGGRERERGQPRIPQVAARLLLNALFTRTVPQELKAEKARVRVVPPAAPMLDPSTDEEVPACPARPCSEYVARAIAMGTTPYYGYELKIFPFAERRSDRFHLRISTAAIPQLLWRIFREPLEGLCTAPRTSSISGGRGHEIEFGPAQPYQTAGMRGSKSKLELRCRPDVPGSWMMSSAPPSPQKQRPAQALYPGRGRGHGRPRLTAGLSTRRHRPARLSLATAPGRVQCRGARALGSSASRQR